MTALVLHIDRLVLRGIDRADAQVVGEALRTALAAQLQGRLPAPTDVAAMADAMADALAQGRPAAPVRLQLPTGTGAAAQGRALGTAVAGHLAPGGRP
jgi:hypothetical protein